MIEGRVGLANLVNISSTAISSTLDFPGRTVKPDNSIETAFDEELGNRLLASRLDQKVGIFHLYVSLSCLKLQVGFVTTRRLFKELGLGVVAGEINEDPSDRFSGSKLFKLLTKVLLLSLESLNLFFLQIFHFEFVLDAAKALLDYDLTPSLAFDLLLFCLGVFVRVLLAKLGNEDLDV